MSTQSPVKIIRDAAFGKRLTETCDANPNVPPVNFGRLGWVKDNLMKKFNEPVSNETVRKWFAGEVKPLPARIAMLAELLEVDQGWLALGVAPELTQREKRTMNTEAEGAVLTVAGLVKMAGGHPAFPNEDDKRANEDNIDLYAIIRGAQYAMHITVAQYDDDNLKFFVPAQHSGAMQIGVEVLGDFAVRLIEIQDDHIVAHGRRRGASIEVSLTPEQAAEFEIKSLRQRL